MTSLTFDPFDEFQKFLSDLSFVTLVKNDEYVAVSKKIHKRALALLIVEHQFNLELRKNSSDLEAASVPFLNEFRSDLLSSLLVFHMGLYKAAMMTARSSLENLFRVMAGVQALDFRVCKSMFDLVELVKTSPLRKSSPTFEKALNLLIGKYGEYCDYVHSSGEEFLSLDRKLGDLPRWQPDVGTERANSLVSMFQSAICLLLTLKPAALHHLRHDQKDSVLDALSMNMKAALVAEV